MNTKKKSTWKGFCSNVIATIFISIVMIIAFSPSLIILIWFPDVKYGWHLLDIISLSATISILQWIDHALDQAKKRQVDRYLRNREVILKKTADE